MRRLLQLLFFILFTGVVYSQTDNAPVQGVSDKRIEIYGFRNARVVTDYQTTLENADILVSNGRIEAVGQNLVFPKGTIIYDLTGKTVYPSFIDPYAANYGVKSLSQASESTFPGGPMGRQVTQQSQEGRIADYWNDGVNSSYDVSTEFIPDSKVSAEYRQAGFGAVVTFRADGLARGTSALVTTGDGKSNTLLIKNKATTNYSFSKGRSTDLYPASGFGGIALLRQLNYDAQWYKQLPAGYFHDDGIEAYVANLSLPQVFEVSNKLEVPRADKIGKEFGLNYIIKGSGDEYQNLEAIKKGGNSLIIPLNYPEAPDVKDPYDAMTVGYETLKHWELAPYNLSMLSKAGVTFAITSSDLKQRSSFLANLRKAVKDGLPEKEALKALTYIPASMTGSSDLVGSIRKNIIANFLITSGNIFSDDCVIYENWVQGNPYRFVDIRTKDVRGTYTLKIDTVSYKMVLSGTFDKPTIKLVLDSTEIKGAVFALDKELVSLNFERLKTRFRLSGFFKDKDMEGRGQTDAGKWFSWNAEYKSSTMEPEKAKKQQAPVIEPGKVIYPFAAYGSTEVPSQEDVLFRNATVWTNEKEGNVSGWDVLVRKGKIAAVGKDLSAPGIKVIDATGLYLTSGIIDEHSHVALDDVNEYSQAIASEVRCSDVIDPEDITIYRQLSGGVTAIQTLHGSADPIGGQSVLIKYRWGKSADELKIDNQVGFLKHALGENVKQTTNRYPNSRMGVEQIIKDAYQRAVDYRKRWNDWNALKPADRIGKIPPRRDLELDPIVDVLEKRSFIVCHAYVQSEIVMMLELAHSFGIEVNTLIHCNEGYKVADKIKEHGTVASVFADWWDYKYEVYEAIAYNASMLLGQGVLVCLNSDDGEMGRRLNQEAAKIMKYGNIPEADAWKLVTLNPAKALHLENRMGSIKTGKDADLVLWSGNPLSVYSRALKTMVDGTFYFDEERDARLKTSMDEERNRIVSNILKESATPASNTANLPRR
ncbi:MAG: amidohydrolase family protein [Bacteroidales bacterium]